MKIYLVATIRNIESSLEAKMNGTFGMAHVYGTRVVGYYPTLEEAKKCVEENWGDIQECYYKYAVIEDVEPGLYRTAESTPLWYKWSKAQEKFLPIDKPAQLSQTFGFTIG